MVLSSAAKAEFGALFHNTKEATPSSLDLQGFSDQQVDQINTGLSD